MKSYIYAKSVRYIWFIFVVISLVPTIASSDDSITISPFTQKIHKRYYVLKRLQRAHDILPLLIHHTQMVTLLLPILDLIIVEDHQVQICIQHMKKMHSLEPLFTLWQDMQHYKWIEKEACARDFARIICALVQGWYAVLVSPSLVVEQKLTKEFSGLNAPLVMLLAVINETLDRIVTVTKSPEIERAYELSDALATCDDECMNTAKISYRYYLIKRLAHPFAVMKRFTVLPKEALSALAAISYNHPAIDHCISQMYHTMQLHPLFELHDRFMHFYALDDIEFIQEYIQLFFTIQKELMEQVLLEYMDEHIADNLHELLVEDILKSIDIITSAIEENQVLPQRSFATTLGKICVLSIAALCGYTLLYN